MKLTPSRKVKLIVVKILEYAEIGGMVPADCGTIYAAIDSCLCTGTEPEQEMDDLCQQIAKILNSDKMVAGG